jgi:hypothetical protein
MIAIKMSSQPDFDQTYFTTYDLGLSAALVAVGFALDQLDNADPRKVKFVFRRKSGLDAVIQNFWGNSCQVDAQTYFNALKMLKNRIYSQ